MPELVIGRATPGDVVRHLDSVDYAGTLPPGMWHVAAQRFAGGDALAGEVSEPRDWQRLPEGEDVRVVAVAQLRWANARALKQIAAVRPDHQALLGLNERALYTGWVERTGDRLRVTSASGGEAAGLAGSQGPIAGEQSPVADDGIDDRVSHVATAGGDQDPMRRRRGGADESLRLPLPLIGSLLAAIAITVFAFLELDAAGEAAVWQEIPKATWQFLLVGLLGLWAKKELDDHRSRQAQGEATNEFRKEMIQRLVRETGRVRNARFLLRHQPSPNIATEQQRELLLVHARLRDTHHELTTLRDAAFSHWTRIDARIQTMSGYVYALASEIGDAGWIGEPTETLSDRPRLLGLLSAASSLPPTDKEFEQEYSEPYEDAISVMRLDMAQPAIARSNGHHRTDDTMATTSSSEDDSLPGYA